MSPDPDDAWLDALAGRAADPASAAADEAGRLRGALAAWSPAAPDEVPATDGEREEALLSRARHVGLLGDTGRAIGRGRRWRLPPTGRLGATLAAAAVVCLAVGLAWTLRPGTETEVVRGVVDGIVRIQSRSPEQAQRALLADLRAVGVTARGYEMLGRYGVDADLPRPPPAAIVQALARRRVPVPADGALRVEFEAAP